MGKIYKILYIRKIFGKSNFEINNIEKINIEKNISILIDTYGKRIYQNDIFENQRQSGKSFHVTVSFFRTSSD